MPTAVEFLVGDRTVILDQENTCLLKLRWYFSASGYAMRFEDGKSVYMHRVVFGDAPEDVDHINGNVLDNRRENLRAATRSQKMGNMKKPASNTSGFKGVSWAKHANKFRARIRILGKPYKHLGYFATAEEAHKAYCTAADRVHGEFAHYG